ncbi:MAG: hypothetical protein Q4C98_04300 [Capnocytophaga sp.]|nr:hypothetical protein [Capnocytophaga sp.]
MVLLFYQKRNIGGSGMSFVIGAYTNKSTKPLNFYNIAIELPISVETVLGFRITTII